MTRPVLVTFVGGGSGEWRAVRVSTVRGDGLSPVDRVAVMEGAGALPVESAWTLKGVTSHERYVIAAEHRELMSRSPGLGRPAATMAALIPIRKSPAWWALAQDERRELFEDRSAHIATGLHYLPAVARRLHHSRDLAEPFDFLTWFEYAPPDAAAFEELVDRLRGTAEWSFVEREVDIRLVRESE